MNPFNKCRNVSPYSTPSSLVNTQNGCYKEQMGSFLPVGSEVGVQKSDHCHAEHILGLGHMNLDSTSPDTSAIGNWT